MKRSCFNGIILIFSTIGLMSCNVEPKNIIPGKYNCDFCKMTVSDMRFASEILTVKGKVFIFDDLHCMAGFVKANTISIKEIKDFYVSDFSGDHRLIKAKESFLFKSEDLHSPMNGNTAAFSDKDTMKIFMQQFQGEPVVFTNLLK